MSADAIESIISRLHDAAFDPRLWTGVLQSIAEAMGAIGAAYIIRDTRSGRIDWAKLLGPSARYTTAYITRFAAKDLLTDLLTHREGRWVRLSEHVPEAKLRRNEWYNDFVLKSGVRDIVAAQVSNTGSHTAVFSIHEGVGARPFGASALNRLNRLLTPLRRAAEVQIRLRELEWKSEVAARAFDHFSTGVIIVDAHGLVVEMNGLAERVVRRGDGLVVQNGALGAARVFETAKLRAAIVSATGPEAKATSSRILIGRHHTKHDYSLGSKHDYILAVSPLDLNLGFYSDPMALIIVVDPDARSPKAEDLSAYFGLSFAEARLATQLMSSKTLGDIAAETGASVATLRSQLRSVLKKINVERQTDLFLVLARVPSSPDVEADRHGDQSVFGR